ncbi:MAG: PAS domain S-box protein, partial [Pirellulales bacterium]
MTPDQFQLIADYASEPLLLVSPTGELLAANKAAARLLDYETPRLRSIPISGITTEPASVIASYLRSGGGRERDVPRSCSLRARSGKLIRCRCETTAVHDGSQTAPASFLVRLFPERPPANRPHPQEVEPAVAPESETGSESHTGGQAAVEPNTLVQAILDSAVDAIITIDTRGRIESFNRAAERMFGYTADEFVGRDVSLLMPPPDSEAHQDYIDKYLKTGRKRIIGIGREVMAVRRDGTKLPVEVAVSESLVGERRLFTGILRDVTERRAAAEQIQLLAEAVRHL